MEIATEAEVDSNVRFERNGSFDRPFAWKWQNLCLSNYTWK